MIRNNVSKGIYPDRIQDFDSFEHRLPRFVVADPVVRFRTVILDINEGEAPVVREFLVSSDASQGVAFGRYPRGFLVQCPT